MNKGTYRVKVKIFQGTDYKGVNNDINNFMDLCKGELLEINITATDTYNHPRMYIVLVTYGEDNE